MRWTLFATFAFLNLAAGALALDRGAPAPNPQQETLGAQLRRLATAAKGNNPIESPPLQGAQPWIALTGAYPGDNATVAQGALYSNRGHAYYAAVGGVTGVNTPPTGTARNVQYSDGSVVWLYYGFQVGDVISNGGNAYEVATAGLPATSGDGPTGSSSSITDGAIIWKYIGPQTAPVFTQSPTHNSSLTNIYFATQGGGPYALISDNTGVIRFEGGWPFVNGAAVGVTVGGPNLDPLTANCGILIFGGLDVACNYQSYAFVAEAAIVEVEMLGQTPFNVIVDGRYISSNVIECGYIGGFQACELDFTKVGGRKPRRITIEATSNAAIRQIAVGPSDTIVYPRIRDNFGVAIVGTSLSTATSASDASHGWSNVFRYLVGFPDHASFAVGGTGLINPGASTNYISHIPGDLTRYAAFRGAPKVILIEAPINDALVGASGITYESSTGVVSLRTAYPHNILVGDSVALSRVAGVPGLNAAWPAAAGTSGSTLNLQAIAGLPGTAGGKPAEFSAAALTRATLTLLQNLRGSFPNALIVGVGSTYGSNNAIAGTANPIIRAAETAFAAGFAAQQASGDKLLGFIANNTRPSPPGPIISGAGKQNNTAGPCSAANGTGSRAGNAFLDVSSDGTHNSDCGYLDWAKAIVPQWWSIIKALP